MRNVIIAGVDFQSDNISTTSTDAFNLAPIQIIAVDPARGNGQVATLLRYGSRTIANDGRLTASSSDNLDLLIDDVKKLANHKLSDYVLDYAGGTRTWVGYLRNVIVSRANSDINVCGYSAELFCPKPYAIDGTRPEFLNETGVTDTYSTFSVDNTGTYLAAPVIEITINTILPAATEATIVIGNPLEGHYLDITGVFADGDVIKIDCDNFKAYHNGLPIAPKGLFPLWSPDNGTFSISHNTSSMDFDIIGDYERRFL